MYRVDLRIYLLFVQKPLLLYILAGLISKLNILLENAVLSHCCDKHIKIV